MSLKSVLEKKDLTYLFLGGKGGVGKTISASAISIEFTKHFDRVLVVSTDPAHSLSDCFDQDLSGGDPVLIEGLKGNLWGMELNAEKGLEHFKEINEMNVAGGPPPNFPGMGGMDNSSADNTTGIPGMDFQNILGMGAELMGDDAVPPGSDEAFAFSKLLELIENNDYDIVVFDTAPTGHTLRFLSLPDYLDSFLGRVLKMRMRFGNLFKSIRNLFSAGGPDEPEDNSIQMLEKLKKTITKARIELADEAKTEFIPVMIPTMMALYETERLINTLEEFSIPVEHIIVNQLIPPSKDCPFCAQRYIIQEKTMLTIKQYFERYTFTEVPMVPQEIRGIEQLQNLAKILFE